MKKSMLSVLLTMFVLGNSVADTESSEIFPLSGITVGMSSKELLENYPTNKTLLSKTNDDNILEEGILLYNISTNMFWDTLMVSLEDFKVESLTYFYFNHHLFLQNPNTRDYEKMVKNVKPLFNQLKRQLGVTFEKKITYGETTETRCAMYIWKREKDVVAFSHSPVSQYKKGAYFDCQLVISPKIENLAGLYERMATDSVPEDAALWADTMDEEKTGTWLFLIIGVSAVIGAVVAWRCFKKRKSA